MTRHQNPPTPWLQRLRMHRGRGSIALTISLACAMALGTASASRATHGDGVPDQTEDDALARLQTLSCPAYEVRFERRFTAADKQAAAAGSFWVFDRNVTLAPPVDWNQAGSRSYLSHLHSMFFMDVLLQMYNETQDPAVYDQALALARDWVTNNVQGSPSTNSLAWYDKVVGDRAPYLAYLTRVGACKGILGDEDARLLIRTLQDHGRVLVSDAEYAFWSNHGLYQDAGLFLLAEYTSPFLDEAAGWDTHARARFKDTLFRLADENEGIWLEHSVAYQFFLVNLLRKIDVQTPLDDPEVDALEVKMADAAAWFVMPNQMQPQLGDTDYTRASGWALGPAQTKTGMNVFFDSGWAVVKTPDSYFITSGTYFSQTHKQADELSFELFEDGERVVVDGGRYSYTESDPFRIHMRSAEAHNGLFVDDVGFTWKGQSTYGSGIQAAGTDGQWYAILARNPLLDPAGVTHYRLFVYKPSGALVVLDDVSSGQSHAYTRALHLGPTVDATWNNYVRVEGNSFTGRLKDYTGTDTTTTFVKGSASPLQGWTSPGEGQKVPTNTVLFRNQRTSALNSWAMALDDVQLGVSSVQRSGLTYAFTLKLGAERSRIYVTRNGLNLSITVKPLA